MRLQPPPVARSEDPPEWSLPGRLLAGRYTVLEVLGQGGMGVVLAAYDARLDRRVALKLLRTGRTSNDELEARMMREAQAMARLNHPHVVQVYDSGHLEDDTLFIAMEYVEGQTLRSWCEAQRRSWREVLEAYLAAGRGLAAAHEAGLIHRDFKPDNVLMGKDGRVRVTDFGLARLELSAIPGSEPEHLETPPPGAWKGPLTRSDWLLGTPLYMAPELLRGKAADVRSDLFAFCVSLHESLHGQPPFDEKGSVHELLDRKLKPPPENSEVPEWVTKVVYQGLREDPEQRPSSMGELLAALEDDPEQKRRARRRVVPLVAGAVLLLPLALWGWVRMREPGCEIQAKRLAGVWDEAMRARVEKALVGTGLPYARGTAERVSKMLDDYARTWVGMRTAVCEEVREQSGVPGGRTLLEEYCLDRRLGHLRATTELLAQGPDEKLLSMAERMVHSLHPLEGCQGEQVPMMRALLPESPELRAKVRSLLERMDPLEPLYVTGRYQEGLELFEELWPEIEPVEYAPLQAHALWLRARLEQAVGRHKEAEATAEQSVELANRGGHARQVSQAWNLMAHIKGISQNRYQLSEVLLLDTMLESMSELTGDDRSRVITLGTRASLLRGKGEYEEARKRYERAVALAETTMGLETYFPDLLNNMGVMYKDLGRYEEAKRSYERSLELRRKAFGPEHPEVAASLTNLGAVLKAEGRYKDARAMMEQALELMERALGPKHPNISLALNSLASVLQSAGQYEEALTLFERVQTRLAEEYGEDHPKGVIVHLNLCSTLVELGRYEEAQAKCERALALGGKGMPKYLTALTHHFQGRVFVGKGRNEEARAKYEQALALLEEALGTKHPACVDPLLGLAELHLARRKPAQALALLERATEIAPQSSRSEVDFLLARALWESGKDRARAPELATAALRHYQELGHPKGEEVRRWLAAHSLP